MGNIGMGCVWGCCGKSSTSMGGSTNSGSIKAGHEKCSALILKTEQNEQNAFGAHVGSETGGGGRLSVGFVLMVR